MEQHPICTNIQFNWIFVEGQKLEESLIILVPFDDFFFCNKFVWLLRIYGKRKRKECVAMGDLGYGFVMCG
jgi:hypothetical protein